MLKVGGQLAKLQQTSHLLKLRKFLRMIETLLQRTIGTLLLLNSGRLISVWNKVRKQFLMEITLKSDC